MAKDRSASSKKTPDPHDRSALLQAFQDVVRDQKGKHATPSGRRRRPHLFPGHARGGRRIAGNIGAQAGVALSPADRRKYSAT